MDIKDIKIGMKVKLLGKHAGYSDKYDNIKDWFEDYYNEEDVQQIKKQGYGVIIYIDGDGEVWVSERENGREWIFLPCDLEPYEEPTQTKSPKEWLLTPSVICTTRDNDKFIVLSNNRTPFLDGGMYNNYSNNLDKEYNEELLYAENYPPNDIVKITYGDKVVYERKEEEVKEMTIDEIEKIIGSKIKIVNNK